MVMRSELYIGRSLTVERARSNGLAVLVVVVVGVSGGGSEGFGRGKYC